MSEQPPKMLPSLTSLRFFAALLIAVYHSLPAWSHDPLVNLVGQAGWLGVSYFFTLSGFVLMWNFDPALPWTIFVWKRISRIYPVHFVCLCVSLLSFLFFGQPLAGYYGTFRGTIANFLLIHDWYPHHPEVRQAWNGVSWTLSCEFMFYLLAPYIFPYMLRNRHITRVFSSVVSLWGLLLLVSLYGAHENNTGITDFLYFHPIPRLVEFMLGASGAILIRKGWTFSSLPLSVVVLVVPVALYCIWVPENAGRQGAVMIQLFIPGSFLLIMSLARGDVEGINSWLHNNLLVYFGNISYAFFMVHALILGIVSLFISRFLQIFSTKPLWGDLMTIIYLCIAASVAAIVHKKLEIPARRWLLSMPWNR
ncbi:MAG: acyltransferase [Negativicutes bacterium]|nr:acyltransferase [Negativicutes bacterium]